MAWWKDVSGMPTFEVRVVATLPVLPFDKEDLITARWEAAGERHGWWVAGQLGLLRRVVITAHDRQEAEALASEQAARDIGALGFPRPERLESRQCAPATVEQAARAAAYQALIDAVGPTNNGHPPASEEARRARDAEIRRALDHVAALADATVADAARAYVGTIDTGREGIGPPHVHRAAEARFIERLEADVGILPEGFF